ncbi:cupin domain-containing protein [Flaviaesturariibacter amylovorans]|uniref:Cupin domain-containing protein n=1 Tax=Flaviaesturariibacter amylovorans TaxID=1084520 RepID=A0ABP8HSG6_9BACT
MSQPTATTSARIFIEDASLPWQDLGGGLRRKVMAWDERLMLVKVAFEQGAVGALHHHPHTQVTHIESGAFEVEVSGELRVLRGGDAFYIPPGAVHGVRCLEAGVLVDVFSPLREDFLPVGA